MLRSDVVDRYEALRRPLAAARGAKLAIPLGGHPDPDAMASGWAFAELAAHEGLYPFLLYVHPVSHVENRLMVRALGVPLVRFEPAQAGTYDAYALVDAHELDPSYASLATLPWVAVWDHHEGDLRGAPAFADLRTDAGSTSTMATEYLEAAGMLDPKQATLEVGDRWPATGGTALSRLATALMIGIASDTEDYLLAHEADFRASAALVGIANRPLLRRIHRRAYSVAAMETLERALSNVVRRGTLGIAWVDALEPAERDTIPQAADLLVSRADLDTALVFGRVGEAIDGSLRTLNPGVNPARMIATALGSDASGRPFGGGREGKGGFRLPLASGTPDEVARLRQRVEEGFLAVADGIPRIA